MIQKYRVTDVAKDLALPSKEITAVLDRFGFTGRKIQTALEENELNILFDFLTQEHALTDLKPYFDKVALRKPKEKPKPPIKPAAPGGKGTPKPGAKPGTPGAGQPGGKLPAKPARPVLPQRPVPSGPPKPAVYIPPVQRKVHTGAAQPKTQKEQHTVDTRAAQVDSGRFDERFDVLAQTSGGGRNDHFVRKQKLTQKSQQYKKPTGKKETESQRLRRIQMERQKKHLVIQVGENIQVGELAALLKATVGEVIKKLMNMGFMVTANEEIDFDTAYLVSEEFHARVEREVVVTIEERIIDDSADTDETLLPRDPVVVVMGHVDHGKTSILDAIRKTSVTAGEAGGITQHIGASRVEVNGHGITFLDTPGHEAFTSMRARGAMATDIAILVVAADDGIMPQTVEAIHHAKAAGVALIVAINKIDKPDANPDRVMQQLTEHEVVPEQWGGDTICVPVSALTGEGLDKLLETVLLVAEMKEFTANPHRAARGIVIEARLDKGRGPIATLLVQNGTLKNGDSIVAGTAVGHVRAMTDDRGQTIHEAGPSIPVEVMGLDTAPTAGDAFNAVSDERLARELVEQRKHSQKQERFGEFEKVTLDNLFDHLSAGNIKELPVIVKADVQGSVEAVRQSLEKLSTDEVRVHVLHGAAGTVTESDIMLAHASNAIIVGFNVRPDPVATVAAERQGVEMRMYRIIYDCINDVEAAMKGLLAPKTREILHGRTEVRQVYKITGAGTIAGCYVLDGKIVRNDLLRVVREGIIIADDKMISLKRFKDDVKEVAAGYECGVGLEKFGDIKVGDIYETYIIEEYRD